MVNFINFILLKGTKVLEYKNLAFKVQLVLIIQIFNVQFYQQKKIYFISL